MSGNIDAVAFWLAIAMFIWFFYGPWQNFWADWYRQEVFSARDRLFDMAMRGEVAFSDNAYKVERRTLNVMIRFADQTTWPQICMTMFLLKILYSLAIRNPENIEETSQEKFDMAARPAKKALLVMLMIRAPLLWPLFAIVGLIEIWELAAKGTQSLTISLMSAKLLRFGQRTAQELI